jgi:hypothetical protein
MKINDITVNESTTSGAIATVASPMTSQKRGAVGKGVYGNEKPGSLLTGKKTSKKYANSVNESFSGENVTVVYIDGKPALKYTNIIDAKKAVELMQKKHPKTNFELKQEVREAKLEEDDLIIVPGQGRSRKSGFIKHGESRLDHEVEMARSDLFSAAKNAKQVYELIADVSEEEGLEGWVQEKIIKANDYLNTIREYLEGKQLQNEMTGGVIAGGGVG